MRVHFVDAIAAVVTRLTQIYAALLVPAMLAAAAEAATAVLAEARLAAQGRALSGRTMLPVYFALTYVAAGALCVCACLGTPVVREVRRAWRAVAPEPPPHPLGELRHSPPEGPCTRLQARISQGNGTKLRTDDSNNARIE